MLGHIPSLWKVIWSVLTPRLYLCQGSSGSSNSSSNSTPAPLRGELASSLGGLLGYNLTPGQSLAGMSGVNKATQQQNTVGQQIAKLQQQVSAGNLSTKGAARDQSKITADQAKLAAIGQTPGGVAGAPAGGTPAGGTSSPTTGGTTPQQNALNQLLQNSGQYQQLGQQETQLALDPTQSSTYQQMMSSLQQQFLNNLGEANVQTGSKFATGGQYDPNSSSPVAQAFAQQAGTGEQALSTAGLQQAFNLLPTEQTAATQYQMMIPNLLAQLGSLLGTGTSAGTQVSGGI